MSTLKVDTIEKYSGSSGVTVKDDVTIEPDAGTADLTVSGATTLNGTLAIAGQTSMTSKLKMNDKDIDDVKILDATTVNVSGGVTCASLTVGGVALLSPIKAFGRFRFQDHTSGTAYATIDQVNGSGYTAAIIPAGGLDPPHVVRVTFSSAMPDNYYTLLTNVELGHLADDPADHEGIGMPEGARRSSGMIEWSFPHPHFTAPDYYINFLVLDI